MLPNINENVTINELTRLNDSLRKNSNVGYQDAFSGGASLAPIVPQSIEGTLASAAHTMRDLALWPMLPKVQATNTLHEYAVISDHGEDLDPFISEGGGDSSFGSSASQYERKSVKIKYMAEKRSVSDVATLVGIVGPNADALAEETERGTMSLLRKMEVQLFHGDEDVNDLAFDGVLKQIEREGDAADYSPFRFGRDFSDNQEDLQGASLSGAKLHEVLGELYSAPRFGSPDAIFMSPKAYSKLIADSAQNGRHDSMVLVDKGDQGVHTLGAGPRIHIMGPMGPVPVVAAPFISRRLSPPRAASAGNTIDLSNGFAVEDLRTNAQFVVDAAAGNNGAGYDDAQGWDAQGTGAGHDGAFRYVVVGVNKLGYSAPVISTANTFADVHSDAIPRLQLAAAVAGSVDYVRIYRCAGELSDAQTLRQAQLIGEVPAANIIGEQWLDAGFERLDADPVLISQMDQSVVEFARLLDFIRRPLAEVGAAKQFLLMLFGAPSVKVAKKNYVLRNVGR